MRVWLLGLALVVGLIQLAHAQYNPGGSTTLSGQLIPTPQSLIWTNLTSMDTTVQWTVPSTFQGKLFIDASAGGGAGGSGQVTSGGGGGGGSGGSSVTGYALSVTPGEVLTITLGHLGLSAAIGSAGGTANNVTLAGSDTALPTLFGGFGGGAGAAGSGGTGGAGRALGGGNGGAAGSSGGSVQVYPPTSIGSAGGGGGAGSAGTAAAGGAVGGWPGASGGGTNGGGGGGSSNFGSGQPGATSVSPNCSQSPVWANQYGGGGCAGGPNGVGGPGAPPFLRLTGSW